MIGLQLACKPIDGVPQPSGKEGQDDEMDAVGSKQEGAEDELQSSEGNVGGNEERWRGSRGEDGLPQVLNELRHNRRGVLALWRAVFDTMS